MNQTPINAQQFVYSGTDELENMDVAVHYNASILKRILKTGSYSASSTVLDFGAGLGTFAELFKRRGLRPDCLEVDHNEARALREKGFTTFESMESVPNEKYELVYSLNVLEHIEDDEEALKDVYSKMKKGGTLFVYVPAFQALYTDFDAHLGHFRRYHLRDLELKLKGAGFMIEKMNYCETLGFMLAYLFKVLHMEPKQVTKKKIWFFDRFIFPFNMVADPLLRLWFGKNIYAVCKK